MRKKPLYWNKNVIALSVASPELEAPLVAAMAQWNAVECGHLKLVFDPRSANRVILRQKHEWSFEPRVLGMTIQTHSGDPAILTQVQIELNQGGRQWTFIDYKNILLHELGHVLGLEHSERFGAVMHEVGQLGDVERKLTKADKAEFCELVPMAQQDSGAQTGCSQTGYSADMGLFVILILVIGHQNFYDISSKFSNLLRNRTSR